MYSQKSEVNSSCEPESADLNTNLCREGKVCSLLSGNLSLAFPTLCVRPLTRLASCLAQGVCSSGWREKGLRKGTDPLSWPLSFLLLSSLSTPSWSPKKMSVFLLMLQERRPTCSFRANSWVPYLGTSVLCIDSYATASDSNAEGSGPRADWWGDVTTLPPCLGDTITFGKCQKKKRKMNKMITYNHTAQRNLRQYFRTYSTYAYETMTLLITMCYYIWP